MAEVARVRKEDFIYFTRVAFDSNKTDNLMAPENLNLKKKEIVAIVTILK